MNLSQSRWEVPICQGKGKVGARQQADEVCFRKFTLGMPRLWQPDVPKSARTGPLEVIVPYCPTDDNR